jgi:hypothetical protein
MGHFPSSCPSKPNEKPNKSRKRQVGNKQEMKKIHRGQNLTCYNCRKKEHIGKNCPMGNVPKPILYNDHYLLRKARNGSIVAKVVSSPNVHAKDIWVPKYVVTNLKGPNPVWVPYSA